MSETPPGFKRPILRDSSHFEWVQGSADPAVTFRLTHDSAWALLSRVRAGVDADTVHRVIDVVDAQGIDDIAQLWAGAPARSLAGVLWRLYLVQQAVHVNAAETTQTFRTGFLQSQSTAPVLVGVPNPAEPENIATLIHDVLHGVFVGDFEDALHRAAAFSTIMSLGSVAIAQERDAHDHEHAAQLTKRALRYSRFAEDFTLAAKLWSTGSLP